jgi:non-ribosomal peptide synthetase component F
MMPPAERQYDSIIDLFLERVAHEPHAPILVHEDLTWDASALSDRVHRLAHLLAEQGLGPGRTVGLCLERSPELIVSVLAVLRVGAAYVPVDPSYPSDRIAAMLEDARPPVVITDRGHQGLFANTATRLMLVEELDLEQGPQFISACPAVPQDLCYVLFTSGSTGRPKGVAMHHAPLLNLIQWQLRTSVLGKGDRTLQFAPISFDVSFQEILTTIAQGGVLVLITDEDRLNSTQLLRKIQDHQVNRLIVPFVALQYLAEAVQRTGIVPASLKEIFTSGEQLRITPVIREFFEQLPGCRFCNQYGPTEGHVVSELELKGDPSTWPQLPNIGSAIDHVTLRVLDEHMQRVPMGDGRRVVPRRCLCGHRLHRPARPHGRTLRERSLHPRWKAVSDR